MKIEFRGVCEHPVDVKRPYANGIMCIYTCDCGCVNEIDMGSQYFQRYIYPFEEFSAQVECLSCCGVHEFSAVMKAVTTMEVVP